MGGNLLTIVVAQKPWGKKRIDDIVKTGAGALNIEAGRISGTSGDGHWTHNREIGGKGIYGGGGRTNEDFGNVNPSPSGRWPSNFALIHKGPDAQGKGGCERVGMKKVKGSHIEKPCDYEGEAGMFGNDGDRPARGIGDPDGYERVDDWKCVEGCICRKLDKQAGEREVSGTAKLGKINKAGAAIFGSCEKGYESAMPNDSGGASRFYFQADWEYEKMEMICSPECPVAKLGKQSGKRPSSARPNRKTKSGYGFGPDGYGESGKVTPTYPDKGTAARYFFQADWEYEKMERTTTGGDMGKHEIICADVIDWAKEYKKRIDKGEAEPFHALVSDPPFEMSFMGKKWDGTGISFQKETWQTLAEVLHPGAFLFVFAGSRGWHRLACALEDAGLIIQPSIFVWGVGVVEVPFCLGWLQGQSFPKATNISRAIDKAAGKEQEIVGRRIRLGDKRNYDTTRSGGTWKGNTGLTDTGYVTIPATDLARAWEGHRYGGQVLKDAASPLVIAYKPLTSIPDCDIIVETTFLLEVLLCTLLSAQDAESLTNQIHQALLAGAGNSVLGNVEDWASPELVGIVEKLSGQGRAMTESFAAGNVLTRDVISQLGVQDDSLAKDMSMSAEIANMLQNTALLWSTFLGGPLNPGNISITKTAIGLTTALKTLKYFLMECISICVTSIPIEGGELPLHVSSVERTLRELIALQQRQSTHTATGTVTRQLVMRGNDQAGSLPKSELYPVIVAQKPWTNPRLDCIVETGAGALWVDGGRIGVATIQTNRYGPHGDMTSFHKSQAGNPYVSSQHQGRWPPNFALCHKKPETCPDCENGVIWKLDGTWISLCPKCETADGPGVWMGGKLDKCPDCGSEIEEQREQRFPSPCPTCDGRGVVGGCRRVGVKRVKGTGPTVSSPTVLGVMDDDNWEPKPTYHAGHADPDGLETVSLYSCQLSPKDVKWCACQK